MLATTHSLFEYAMCTLLQIASLYASVHNKDYISDMYKARVEFMAIPLELKLKLEWETVLSFCNRAIKACGGWVEVIKFNAPNVSELAVVGAVVGLDASDMAGINAIHNIVQCVMSATRRIIVEHDAAMEHVPDFKKVMAYCTALDSAKTSDELFEMYRNILSDALNIYASVHRRTVRFLPEEVSTPTLWEQGVKLVSSYFRPVSKEYNLECDKFINDWVEVDWEKIKKEMNADF